MENAKVIAYTLRERFGEDVTMPSGINNLSQLEGIASHCVCRKYSDRSIDFALIRLLCACALSAPSKSDLQQRDILIVSRASLRKRIADLMPDMPWVAEAPAFLVFCANGRRLPQIAKLRDKPFPNDHLDLFFNAVGDAAIALATFLCAAEEIGLGCCPISEIRNHASLISLWLGLPERVIPFSAVCLGWPAKEGKITPRLPLSLTVHENQYSEVGFEQRIGEYDHRRESQCPYLKQREPDRWGNATHYGWSEDKARQYAEPLRTNFGTFVRKSGFSLE